MYTDNRVKLKQTVFVTKQVAGGPSLVVLLLGLLITPLGWLFAILGPEGEARTKTVKQKATIKIPQCQLCFHQSEPPVEQYIPDRNVFQVLVHPEFANRLQALADSDAPDPSSRSADA